LIFPGGIDPHVHLDMLFMGTFSSDSYETGTVLRYLGNNYGYRFYFADSRKSLRSALEEWKGSD
jgi:dihydropyrimidinase